MGFGYTIGRFWFSLFHYEAFCGIWFSLGYDQNCNCIDLQIQFMWLQLIIGFDL